MAKRNDVGYGRPPIESQFKPGQSGNPKGRPKGSAGLAAIIEKAINERVVVTENGVRRVRTKIAVAVTQIVNKAVSGNERAIVLVLDMLRWSSGFAPADAFDTEEDRRFMQNLSKRFRQSIDSVADEGESP